MIFNNFIGVEQDLLDKTLCDDCINYLEHPDRAGSIIHELSEDKDMKIIANPSKYGSFQRMHNSVMEYLYQGFKSYREQYPSCPRDWKESGVDYYYKIQKSSSGGGFTSWHYEQNEVNNRYLVWMVYLNNVEAGTQFLYQDVDIKPTAGTLVIWPAGWTHTHRSAQIKNETKYILTGWWTYHDRKR